MQNPSVSSQTMTTRGHTRAILVLGLPLIGSHLGQMAISITDTVMLGWYSVQALAAITLGATYLHLLLLVGSGFAWAVMPMVATFQAEDDAQSLRRATRMGLWLSAVFGICVMPLLIWSDPLLRMMGQTPEVATDAARYLTIAGWSLFPWLGIMVIKSYLAALELTRPVLMIVLASALFNALFNWAFIFGNWGAPEMGLAGAAWATIVTNSLAFLGVVWYARRALPEHDLFARLWKVDRPMLARVFALGWPIGLTTLSEAGLFSASAIMMGWLGTIPLAAHGIALQCASITFMVHLGLSNVATVRAGNALGRKDRAHLARGANVVTAMSLGFAALTVLIFLVMPEALIGLFMDKSDPAWPEVLQAGIILLIAAALFQLMDGAQVIALGLLRGIQETRWPMVVAGFSYWVIGVPASYVFGFVLGWGGFGVWMGLILGLAIAAIALMARFWRTSVKTVPYRVVSS